LSKSNSSRPDIYIINSSDNFSYFISSSNILKKCREELIVNKFDKWNKKYLIFNTSDFLLLPKKLPVYLKKLNIENTLGINKNSKKKTIQIKDQDLKLTYFYNQIRSIRSTRLIAHISEILINEFTSIKNKSKETFVVFFDKKIHISIIERGKLIFYNQFNFKNQNYIKYIILTFEEFNHDRKKSKIYIVESSQNFKRINNEMKKYFNNINLYKKSIFEIIQNYYE
tara:strand:+ start:806 stop:1483 length:678 start_codon:yes stop_codon:yes gene_type:complete